MYVLLRMYHIPCKYQICRNRTHYCTSPVVDFFPKKIKHEGNVSKGIQCGENNLAKEQVYSFKSSRGTHPEIKQIMQKHLSDTDWKSFATHR